MKITLDKDTMPDELYNMLLQHFVNEAVAQEHNVSKYSQFNDWQISCELTEKVH